MSQIQTRLSEISQQVRGQRPTTSIRFYYDSARYPVDTDPFNHSAFSDWLQEQDRLREAQRLGTLPPGQFVVDDDTLSERICMGDYSTGPDLMLQGCGILRLSTDPADKPRLCRPTHYGVHVGGVDCGRFPFPRDPEGLNLIQGPVSDEQIKAWLAAAEAREQAKRAENAPIAPLKSD